jgi:hypothetical protein
MTNRTIRIICGCGALFILLIFIGIPIVQREDREHRQLACDQALAAPFEPKVFKTIKLGTEESNMDLLNLLERDYLICPYVEQMMKKVVVADSEIEVDLVVVTPRELGFTENTRFDVICERAVSLGMERPSAEVGPQLRLQYADQPQDDRMMIIAMEPITSSDGVLELFGLGHGNSAPWLFSIYGAPDRVRGLDGRFVFCLPKKVE